MANQQRQLQVIEILYIIQPRSAPYSLSTPWGPWWVFHQVNQSRNEVSPKMFCVGIREHILFDNLLYVFEVSSHPVLEVLLCVTDVDLARCFTLDLVDHFRNSAKEPKPPLLACKEI
jgi:hypothetical protein